MRMPTRLKTRLDTLMPNRLRSFVRRYFRRNEGTTDYASIPEVVLSGDFVISFDVLPEDTSTFHQMLSGTGCTFNIRVDDYLALVVGNSDTVLYSSEAVVRNAFNSIKLSREGSSYTFEVNGVAETVTGDVSDFLITRIMGRETYGSLSPLRGILANLKIWDGGPLIRDYPLDDNSSTLVDNASGQNGTIINGNNEDWGLFTKQANGDWKGNGLDVPPWDSVDQVLVKS